MRSLLFVVVSLLLTVPAYAQTGAPTSWTLRTFIGSTQTTVDGVLPIPLQAVTCDLAPEAGVDNVVNPKRIGFDDPARPGRQCQANVEAYVAALPDGTGYTFEITAVNADGATVGLARSNPFVRRRPNPPAAPTGLKAIP